LSASWSVGKLVVGELDCRRVVQLPGGATFTLSVEFPYLNIMLNMDLSQMLLEFRHDFDAMSSPYDGLPFTMSQWREDHS